MIKGVSKNIIEVNPREHDYFEKVIIILKESPDNPDENVLRQNISLLIGEKPPTIALKHRTDFFKLFSASLIGSVISFFLCWITLLFV